MSVTSSASSDSGEGAVEGSTPRRGWRVAAAEDAAVFVAAIRAALDYRGDVTLARCEPLPPLAGYLYDVDALDDPTQAVVRMLPQDGGPRITVPLRDVAAVEFTGRDTAVGKSFETWIRKYAEKKRAGEPANFEPAPEG